MGEARPCCWRACARQEGERGQEEQEAEEGVQVEEPRSMSACREGWKPKEETRR